MVQILIRSSGAVCYMYVHMKVSWVLRRCLQTEQAITGSGNDTNVIHALAKTGADLGEVVLQYTDAQGGGIVSGLALVFYPSVPS